MASTLLDLLSRLTERSEGIVHRSGRGIVRDPSAKSARCYGRWQDGPQGDGCRGLFERGHVEGKRNHVIHSFDNDVVAIGDDFFDLVRKT